MKIAILTTDNREQWSKYDLTEPVFGTAPAALLQGFAMLSNVEIHVISCVRQPMKSPEKIAPNIWYHALLVPKIGWMSTGYQGCIRAARKKLQELQPDIVHGQGTERDCGMTAIFSGFPNVLTIHGNMRLIARLTRPPLFSFNWFNKYVEAFTIPRSLGVVCITNYTREAVRDLARRTWVVPNAVDANFFDVKSRPDSVPTVLVVGLISPRKNQNAFILALDDLVRKIPFRVRFIGNAADDVYSQEFLHLVSKRAWCEYAGPCSPEEVRRHLCGAGMLALPSLEDNCPMVVLEAMAAGVPVLAANVGGIPDLVEDRRTGLLCDPTRPASMSDAVEWMFGHPAEVRTMAETANREARERFHPRVIASRHVGIYREVTGRSMPGFPNTAS